MPWLLKRIKLRLRANNSSFFPFVREITLTKGSDGMAVLKVIGIVLGAILLLVLLLLTLPVRIRVKLDGNGKYFFAVRILFVTLFSKYSGKPEKKKKTSKKEPKRKKSAVSSKFSDLFGLKELFEGGDTVEALTEGLRLITNILREIRELLPGCRVTKLKVEAVISSDDPAKEAMTYGLACAAVYPFVGLIKSFMKVSEKGTEIDMRCSFGKEEAKILFETVVGTSVFMLVRAALRIFIGEAKNAVMKEG